MLLVATDPRFGEHDPGLGHVERPARYQAVLDGLHAADIDGAIRPLPPRTATRAELERVHRGAYLDQLEAFCRRGGGPLDPDTVATPSSWDIACAAAGAGLAAIDALGAGDADHAFCAVRPPGHHAESGHAMGFCLLNNIAVAAAAVRAKGQRVVIVDWDAHHGNGTQHTFYDDPDVMYVSLHEWPLYPGTGRLDEVGSGAGTGANVNFPLPAGATGDVFLAALDTVVAPLVEAFRPDWMMVSAGFDAHRADPLTGLGLSAGDYADIVGRLCDVAPSGRTIHFLEGGYDLEALRDSVAATASALAGVPRRPEPPTTGGPGRHVVRAAHDVHGVI